MFSLEQCCQYSAVNLNTSLQSRNSCVGGLIDSFHRSITTMVEQVSNPLTNSLTKGLHSETMHLEALQSGSRHIMQSRSCLHFNKKTKFLIIACFLWHNLNYIKSYRITNDLTNQQCFLHYNVNSKNKTKTKRRNSAASRQWKRIHQISKAKKQKKVKV